MQCPEAHETHKIIICVVPICIGNNEDWNLVWSLCIQLGKA
jgi:hypothetical protein